MKQLALAMALATTLVPAAAFATSFVRVADEALVDQAGLVVVGTVISRSTPHGLMATDYRVRVEERLAGSSAAELVVRVPGGGDGPARRKIWGAPSFQPGERTLLFLDPGEGGTWRVLHLFLGAFHAVQAGERSVAARDLSEVSEVKLSAGGELEAAPAGAEPVRDFAAFARWVAARRRGETAPDYRLSGEAAAEARRVAAKATYFEDPDDGRRMRWFNFDTGGHVGFLAYNQGQQGISGGGYSEFQTALAAWNAETQTPIDYRYDGKTSVDYGPDPLAPEDDLNTIVFNDPRNLIAPYLCTGGVLAFGGPVYLIATQNFHGEPFHPIISADIVVADGLGCFFSGSPNATKAAQELFAHELGHTLGLAHSCGDRDSPECGSNAAFDDALMRAFVHDDARGALLATDDRNGIHSLYAPGSGGAPAAPTALVAAAVSTTQVHLTWVDNATNETGFVVEYSTLGGTFHQFGGELPANTTSADVSGLAEATGYLFRVRARNANGDSAFSNVASAATNATVAPCVETATTLCLNHDRFKIAVQWQTSDGETGVGTTIPFTDDSGLVWFFSATNLELMIKVLDACVAPFDHFWVFLGGTTDVQFLVTVVDTQTGAVRVYLNELGHPANAVTDTGAFATCP